MSDLKITTICMSHAMHKRAKRLAIEENTSFSELVRFLLSFRVGYDDDLRVLEAEREELLAGKQDTAEMSTPACGTTAVNTQGG